MTALMTATPASSSRRAAPRRANLTKRTADAAKALPDRDLLLWDAELTGFALRVKPSGRRTWVIQYRNAEGRVRRVTIGTPDKLTPQEAREQARRMLARTQGDRPADPAEDRRHRRAAPTVAALAERFLAEHVAAKLKPSTQETVTLALRNHILPALGRRRVEAVTAADVAAVHHGLRATPAAANHVLAYLSKMFALAVRWGLRPDNPARGLERYRSKRRDRLVSPAEMARLGATLAAAEADGSEDPFAIAAIRLLLLTGCRKSEVLSLEWRDVDLERARLVLRDAKTGPRDVPLAAPALLVLSKLPRHGRYVIAGSGRDRHFVGLHRPWARLRRRAELDDVRIHDLRHAFASVGAGGGESLFVLGRILGHSAQSMTERYAHLSDDPKRAAAERVAGAIAAALQGAEGELVQFPRKSSR